MAVVISLHLPARALESRERLHAVLNAPVVTNQWYGDLPISGHDGLSLDVDIAWGNSDTLISPGRTTNTTSILRYTFAFGAPPGAPEPGCDLTGAGLARVAAGTVVWALSNRLIRGNSDAGEMLPGGATLWGHTVPWLFAAGLHSNLTYGQALSFAAADILAEQSVGWSESLDMGLSSELPVGHPDYNPGNRTEDTIGMAAHLYRARSLSLGLLEQEYGVSDVALASPMVGAAGYQLGRILIEENVVPGWDQKGLWADLVGSRPYHIGELVHGGMWGAGVARTLECAK